MAIQTKTTTLNDVSTEINLKELLGPVSKDRDVREAFFEVALERMTERLNKGRDVNNSLFKPPYSDSYKNSLAFKAFNKSDTINMQLSGDMLSSVQILKQDDSIIKVGVSEDEAPKAFNHQTGDTLPKREWFGWTDKELKEIAKEFKPAADTGPTIPDSVITGLLDRLLGNG